MADLKPCPFCGSTPRYLPTNPGFYTARVICDHCHFHLPVAAWQQRKTSDGVKGPDKC
jgi:hypothetical protein